MTDAEVVWPVGTTDRDPKLSPAIDQTYPLGDIAAAIRHLLDGKARGKLAVSVSPGHRQATPTGSTS
jgi:NADPH:quinone reductase-like Zn-dependent oxidoreductase